MRRPMLISLPLAGIVGLGLLQLLPRGHHWRRVGMRPLHRAACDRDCDGDLRGARILLTLGRA